MNQYVNPSKTYARKYILVGELPLNKYGDLALNIKQPFAYMGKWKLANSKEPNGLLSDTTEFLSPKNKLGACFVSIPTIMDIKIAIDNIRCIILADT